MPILSAVSNSGLTAYSNRLKKVLSAYNNSGYSGKDPLWHATTALVTAATWRNINNSIFIDALLVAAGGGGGSGGSGLGGGGAGGYLYASGIQVPTFASDNQAMINFEVGMARATESNKHGPKGSETFIDAGNLWAYGGNGGGGDGDPYGTAYQGPGTVGYYTRTPGKGSNGGSNNPTDFTPWQGNAGGDNRFTGGDYIGGGGGGAGSAGGPVSPIAPSETLLAGIGGNGITVSFPGFGNFSVCGGGGGGHSDSTSAGRAPGGSGGGGAGGYYVRIGGPGPNADQGTVGTGPLWNAQLGQNASSWGAGGGASTSSIWGGRGGNGMLFIKYPMYMANAVFYNFGDDGNERDDLIMQYTETGGYRCFMFTPKSGAVTPDGKNRTHAKGKMYFPHTLNHVFDDALGLINKPHRLNFREADRVGLTTFDNDNYLPIPSTFSPFSTNGWSISLNEETQTSGSGTVGIETDPFCWLSYPNNLTDFTDIGTGDFMLQTYVKKGYGSSGNGIWGDGTKGGVQPFFFLKWASGAYIQFANFYDSGNAIGYSSSGTGGTRIVNPTAASVNTWYKVRIQRSLGVVSVFVDDVRVASGSDTANYSGTPTLCYIGTNDSYQGVYSSGDIQAFIGQISGLVFKKVTTNLFDLRNSNNFRNVLNSKTVIPFISGRTDLPKPSPQILAGSLATYSTTSFPSNDKIASIYWTGNPTINTSITWDGYYPNGIPNSSPTYVFTANTSDFCVDGWVYPTSNTASQILFNIGNNDEDYFTIYTDPSSRRLAFVASRATPATTLYGPSGGIIANSWTHFVVQREGGTVKVFTNGEIGDTQTGTGAATYNFNDATLYPTLAGKHSGSSTKFRGYTTQFRYSRFARIIYSGSSYTVPTTPVSADSASLFINGAAGGTVGPPLWDATQKNQFIQAGNHSTVTTSPINSTTNSGAVQFAETTVFPNQYYNNGSLYSAGLGHYIRFVGPYNQKNFKFGTSDFCVEGWWTADYVPSQKTLIDFRELTTDIAFAIKIDTSNRILLVVVNTTRITSAPITLGTPVHIAVERVSGVTSLYINGVRSGDTYADTNNYIARPTRPDLFTDGTSESNESFVGNMHIMRVTKDYPRYSANFSPGPTAIYDTIGLNQTYFPYN